MLVHRVFRIRRRGAFKATSKNSRIKSVFQLKPRSIPQTPSYITGNLWLLTHIRGGETPAARERERELYTSPIRAACTRQDIDRRRIDQWPAARDFNWYIVFVWASWNISGIRFLRACMFQDCVTRPRVATGKSVFLHESLIFHCT